MSRKAHQRAPTIARREEGEQRRWKPPRCAACGAKLEKVGYRVWIEGTGEAVIAELKRLGRDASGVEANLRIQERLGGDGYFPWPDSERYFGLKREAIEWCREQAALADV